MHARHCEVIFIIDILAQPARTYGGKILKELQLWEKLIDHNQI